MADLLPVMNATNDVEVELVVYHLTGSATERRLLESGIRVTSLDLPLRSPRIISRLRPFIKGADIVHVHLFPSSYIVALANLGIGKPLVFTEHSTHNRRRDKSYFRPLERWIYSRYTKVGCISDATAANLTEWIGRSIAAPRVAVIENGIDLTVYQNAEAAPVKELFGREGKPLLMVSRFVPAKDQATVIRALPYLSDPDIFVAFAGDGETLEAHRKLVQELGLEKRVVFLGNRDDIPTLIKSTFIGIQSSHWEGFGLTAVEMMAGGLPVIASDVDGLRQVVEGAGMIFPQGNEQALADAVNNINNNDALRTRLITMGLSKAHAYSILTSSRKYFQLYTKVVSTSI